jgi:hypothetical protein
LIEEKLTIFVVVTHLVLLEARRVDGFFCYADFVPSRRSKRTRRVNGGFVDADFFAVGWLEARWVNSCLVDTYFLTIAWLKLGSVLTLSYVDFSIVATTVWKVDFDLGVMTTVMRKVDVNFSVVVSAVVWKVDVDVCFRVSVFGSEEEKKSAS